MSEDNHGGEAKRAETEEGTVLSSTEAGLLNPSDVQKSSIPKRVDLRAHEGLRGIAALWVMLFHCFTEATYVIDFNGSSLMPLFFVLTSLTLTLAYNKLNPSQEEIKNDPSLSSPKNSISGFYNNRMIRVAPVYYLMNYGLALPLWIYGWGESAIPLLSASAYGVMSIVTTATFTSTLFGYILGVALDGPSWTVQTFVFLWAVYPFSLQRARTMESRDLQAWIVYLFYIQLGLLFVIYYVLISFLGFWEAFCFSTMNPVSRYPLFLMGVYAGELVYRSSKGLLVLSDYWPKSFLGLPYYCGSSCCSRDRAIDKEASFNNNEAVVDSAEVESAEGARWTSKANLLAFGLTFIFLAVTTIDRIVKNISNDPAATISPYVWLQALVPFAQLEFLVALTRTSKEGILYKTLTTRLAKFLGAISMTVYLTHYPIIRYVMFASYHWNPLLWPSDVTLNDPTNADTISFKEKRHLPLWGIPIVVAITVPLATIVFYGYEEPIRRYFYKK